MPDKKFHFSSLKEIDQKASELGLILSLSGNLSVLGSPLAADGHKIRNRLAIQPMEGCDGMPDGSPGELTRRRYRRFALSGAGLIWSEAVAVKSEGRANPRQLMLTPENLDAFKSLVSDIKETSLKRNGFAPVIVMQLTHSGRYAKPEGRPAPLIVYHSPIFEKSGAIDDRRIVTDDYLKGLEEDYAASAGLAEQAGFDGVDIKACHRYLISETLSAYTRPGRYGGSFENRIRFYCDAVASARSAVSGGTFITSRLNLYDGFPYPYGFGADAAGGLSPDMSEPVRLVGLLHHRFRINLLNYTLGNPYVNPHVNRPFDAGPYEPDEHPLKGVARMCRCIAEVRAAVPEVMAVSSGNSYLRQFSANLAAGMVESGKADLAGFGREAFAYPEFPHDILEKGCMDSKKCCITCGKCTELMRAGSTAGCVVRDSGVYLPIYRRDVLKNS